MSQTPKIRKNHNWRALGPRSDIDGVVVPPGVRLVWPKIRKNHNWRALGPRSDIDGVVAPPKVRLVWPKIRKNHNWPALGPRSDIDGAVVPPGVRLVWPGPPGTVSGKLTPSAASTRSQANWRGANREEEEDKRYTVSHNIVSAKKFAWIWTRDHTIGAQ